MRLSWLGISFLSPKTPGLERQEGQSGSHIVRACECNPTIRRDISYHSSDPCTPPAGHLTLPGLRPLQNPYKLWNDSFPWSTGTKKLTLLSGKALLSYLELWFCSTALDLLQTISFLSNEDNSQQGYYRYYFLSYSFFSPWMFQGFGGREKNPGLQVSSNNFGQNFFNKASHYLI